MRRGVPVLLLLVVGSFAAAPTGAAAVDKLRGAGVSVNVVGSIAVDTLDGSGGGGLVRDVQVGGDNSTLSSLDETTYAALLAAFGGGDAAAAARVAAWGDAARVASSPVPFKLTNCDATAAIQAREVGETEVK